MPTSKQHKPAKTTKTDPEPPMASGHVTPSAVRIMPVMRSRLGVIVVKLEMPNSVLNSTTFVRVARKFLLPASLVPRLRWLPS
jgi:hypothetical protein